MLDGLVIRTVPAVPPVPPATVGTPAQNFAYLVQIDPATGAGTVVAEISGTLLAAAGISPTAPNNQVTALPAAAVGNNGLLYFNATVGGTPGLFTIDPRAGAGAANTVNAIPGNFGGKTVSALSSNNGLTGAGGTQIFNVNTLNTNLGGGGVGAVGEWPYLRYFDRG